MFGITALVAVLQLIALPFCPESPRYLLAIKNDEHSAIKSKCFLGLLVQLTGQFGFQIQVRKFLIFVDVHIDSRVNSNQLIITVTFVIFHLDLQKLRGRDDVLAEINEIKVFFHFKLINLIFKKYQLNGKYYHENYYFQCFTIYHVFL